MANNMLTIDCYIINLSVIIGKGQYGTVYECKSKKLGEEKLNLCAKIMDVKNDKYAEREAQILNLIKNQYKFNQNIVQVNYVNYDASQKKMIVVMERCQTTLEAEWKNKINRREVYTSEMIRDFLKQILIGYQPLYNNCIIHRDLKPENIMINMQGPNVIYKLADFGVGKNMNDEKLDNSAMQTQTGTPVYAPPEINFLIEDESLRGDLQKCQELNSVDIYSIGMIMWQMMFGDFPFCKNFVAKPQLSDIITFMESLKAERFQVFNGQNVDQYLLQLIKRMIVYYPSKRITFKELYQQFKIDLPNKEKQGSGSSGSTNYSDNVNFQEQFPFSNFNRLFFYNQQMYHTPQEKTQIKNFIPLNQNQQLAKLQNIQQPNNFQQQNLQPKLLQPAQQPVPQQPAQFPFQSPPLPPPPPLQPNQNIRFITTPQGQAIIKLKDEIVDYLKFMLDNKIYLKDEKVKMFEEILKNMASQSPDQISAYQLQNILRDFKQEFVYKSNSKLSQLQTRFHYLIGLVFECPFINNEMLEVKQFQMYQKLEEWLKRNQNK